MGIHVKYLYQRCIYGSKKNFLNRGACMYIYILTDYKNVIGITKFSNNCEMTHTHSIHAYINLQVENLTCQLWNIMILYGR